MKGEKLEALLALLSRPGASKYSLSSAGLNDQDCRSLVPILRTALTDRKVPVALGAKRGAALLFCDGASRGNPGEAALGYAIFSGGEEIASEGITLGVLTNNQAEYHALIAGLAAARRMGLDRVEIAMDSELVVRQITGRYKVKNEGLKPLYREAMASLDGFAAWTIRHVPRAENSRADALANSALDSL